MAKRRSKRPARRAPRKGASEKQIVRTVSAVESVGRLQGLREAGAICRVLALRYEHMGRVVVNDRTRVWYCSAALAASECARRIARLKKTPPPTSG